MEIITSFIQWLFIESIYGITLIAATIFLLATGIQKIIPKFPNPTILAIFSFLIALFTLPSLPRYQFENESLEKIKDKKWIRVINKTHWSSLTEPFTWFNSPIGSIYIIMPNSLSEGGFREVLLRYGEEAHIKISDPDCSDKTIFYSVPNKKGIFQYTSNLAQSMSKKEISIYCEYNWLKEKEALLVETLKKSKFIKKSE